MNTDHYFNNVTDYYFNAVEPRRKRNNKLTKWCRYSDDVIPAWIAEHDFIPPSAVTETLASIVENHSYGYHNLEQDATAAFASWAARRYMWETDTSLMDTQTGALVAVTSAITSFAARDEGVILPTPIYNEFWHICPTSRRRQLEWPMRYDAEAGWHLHPDDLEALLAKEPEAKTLLWCNPHNPTGWVPDKSVLTRIVELAHAYDIYIVSDEIHADFLYKPASFTPMLTIPGASERVIAIASAAKTFALSGLSCAVTIYGNPDLRERVHQTYPPFVLKGAARMGLEASIAAWNTGAKWLDACIADLTAKRDYLHACLADEAPNVRFHKPQSTFLAWLDVSKYDMGDSPAGHMLRNSKLAVKEGLDFGKNGKGHVRVNFGTSHDVLNEVIDRLVHSLRMTLPQPAHSIPTHSIPEI